MTLPRCIEQVLSHLDIPHPDTIDEYTLGILKDNEQDILSLYTDSIKSWRWGKIRSECEINLRLNEDKDCLIGETYLGSYLSSPSGKVYQCWSSNITEAEAYLDEVWEDALANVCIANGLFLSHNDEGDHVACLHIDFETYEDNSEEYNFFDNDAYLAYEAVKNED